VSSAQGSLILALRKRTSETFKKEEVKDMIGPEDMMRGLEAFLQLEEVEEVGEVEEVEEEEEEEHIPCIIQIIWILMIALMIFDRGKEIL